MRTERLSATAPWGPRRPALAFVGRHSLPPAPLFAIAQPPAVKSFIDEVLATPEDRIADALEGFTWQYEKVMTRIGRGPSTMAILIDFARDHDASPARGANRC